MIWSEYFLKGSCSTKPLIYSIEVTSIDLHLLFPKISSFHRTHRGIPKELLQKHTTCIIIIKLAHVHNAMYGCDSFAIVLAAPSNESETILFIHMSDSWFGLVSLFNGISTFVGYLMPKPFSEKNSNSAI